MRNLSLSALALAAAALGGCSTYDDYGYSGVSVGIGYGGYGGYGYGYDPDYELQGDDPDYRRMHGAAVYEGASHPDYASRSTGTGSAASSGKTNGRSRFLSSA